jgi:hypothetical protein
VVAVVVFGGGEVGRLTVVVGITGLSIALSFDNAAVAPQRACHSTR